MSELSSLIEIAKNIEKQNDEIIRLLKKIAEDEDEITEEIVEEEREFIKVDVTGGLGEVFFMENLDIFKLSVKDSETTVNNLTGNSECEDYSLQEFIANESIRRNEEISPSTVIFSLEQVQNLAEMIGVCHEQDIQNIHTPWYTVTQLVGAPDNVMEMFNIQFYKTEEQLLKNLFGSD